jgi:tRNA A37 threonylcarbamoyladenosine modification protein TsaB
MEIALYKDGTVVKSMSLDGMASDALMPAVLGLLEEGVEAFYYTSGPGSHMSTKICYTLLKSI